MHLRRRFAGQPNVVLVEAAVSVESGTARFTVPAVAGAVPEPALGTLTGTKDADSATSIDIDVRRIDEYCADFDRLAFLKVDAEGADLDVLRGARNTIRRLRPVIQFECNDPDLLPGFVSFADENGYRVEEIAQGGANRLMKPADGRIA
jgi:FkbM family methyltransferase